eukprot:g26236.t1
MPNVSPFTFGDRLHGHQVVFACVVLNLAASGILPVEIAPWELDRWRVRPAPKSPPQGGRPWLRWELPEQSDTAEEMRSEAVFFEPDDASVKGYKFTPPYRLRGRWLLPAILGDDIRRRDRGVLHPAETRQKPTVNRTLPVPVRFEAMVRHLQQQRFFRRPVPLRRVMAEWQQTTAKEQVRRQRRQKESKMTKETKDLMLFEFRSAHLRQSPHTPRPASDQDVAARGKGRGRGHIGRWAMLRCRLRSALEPTPSVTVRLRPSYCAEVTVLLVLFAWLALGVRSFFWMLMCCHLCRRWFPLPLVLAAAMLANLLRYRVKRRLVRLQMMRTRSQLEGDALLLLLLLLGASCAGQGGLLRTLDLVRTREGELPPPPPPPQELDSGLGLFSWLMLVLVAWLAMATVAKRPEGHDAEGANSWAALWHGCAWAAAGALLCLAAVAPIFAW